MRRYGRLALFHLVCGRRCYGRLCHGHELARLFQQVADSLSEPPFPKELKWTVSEIMNDLAILMHVSVNTGLPLFQLVTDVKDFFNQHKLAACDVNKVGMITLDPRAIVEHSARLRAAEPDLASVAESVLGYGLFPASNICQRHAYLLIFVWTVYMLRDSEPIVTALSRRYPFLRRFLEQRREQLESRGPQTECRRLRFLQARLWTASMYTDDGHFAILSIDLMICGLRVWRRITGELRLTMAIIQKHGLGQLVTHQGFRFNTGLGLVYVPEDKARRALEQLDAALAGTINLSNYASLLGLLQSMLFVMGMRKASTYGLYAPFAGQLVIDNEELLRVTPLIRDRLAEWRERLCQRAGSSFAAAVEAIADSEQSRLEDAPIVFILRSDAAKEGVGQPGLGGALGGHIWRYALSEEELQLPIAVLEFAAFFGEVEVHGPFVPANALVLAEVDALSTADALTTDSAGSPLMQLIHRRLLEMPAFVSLSSHMVVAHVYGDANVMADAASRNLVGVIGALAQQLGLAVEMGGAGPRLAGLMRELLKLQRHSLNGEVFLPVVSDHDAPVRGSSSDSPLQQEVIEHVGRPDPAQARLDPAVLRLEQRLKYAKELACHLDWIASLSPTSWPSRPSAIARPSRTRAVVAVQVAWLGARLRR